MYSKRFDILVENHIGVGVRWDNVGYSFRLLVSVPFVTLVVGFGTIRVRSKQKRNSDRTSSVRWEVTTAVTGGVMGVSRPSEAPKGRIYR